MSRLRRSDTSAALAAVGLAVSGHAATSSSARKRAVSRIGC
jgi:hypothetical protein